MRIHPIRLGVVGAVIASGSFLFAMSAGASTSASPANITQFQQSGLSHFLVWA
jgi:acyl dehydratase